MIRFTNIPHIIAKKLIYLREIKAQPKTEHVEIFFMKFVEIVKSIKYME